MFSDLQNKVIKVLGDKKMSITDISKKVYKDDPKTPLAPNNSIVSTIHYINLKCEKHGLKWYIYGEGKGQYGKIVYIAKR